MPLDDPAVPLAPRLWREIRGEVLFDQFSRRRYATDASIYQTEALGMVAPQRREDAATANAIAREEEGASIAARCRHFAMRADPWRAHWSSIAASISTG